jgi:hypothetical protein
MPRITRLLETYDEKKELTMMNLLVVDETVTGNLFLPVRLGAHRFGLARSGSAEVEHKEAGWVVTADVLTTAGVMVQTSLWDTFREEREAENYRDSVNQASAECP